MFKIGDEVCTKADEKRHKLYNSGPHIVVASYSDGFNDVVELNNQGGVWYSDQLCLYKPENVDVSACQVEDPVKESEPEYTGASVSYYKVFVKNPTDMAAEPYMAECNDIIRALKMSYCEGNAFKAIWRSCAARNLGLAKKGYDNGLYDAQKVVFFGTDMIKDAEEKQ